MRILIINPLGVDVYDPMVERAIGGVASPDTKAC